MAAKNLMIKLIFCWMPFVDFEYYFNHEGRCKNLTPNLVKDCIENNVDILHKYFLGNQQTMVYYP